MVRMAMQSSKSEHIRVCKYSTYRRVRRINQIESVQLHRFAMVPKVTAFPTNRYDLLLAFVNSHLTAIKKKLANKAQQRLNPGESDGYFGY